MTFLAKTLFCLSFCITVGNHSLCGWFLKLFVVFVVVFFSLSFLVEEKGCFLFVFVLFFWSFFLCVVFCNVLFFLFVLCFFLCVCAYFVCGYCR